MSWRVLLFGAAVIAILYGAADVVFSSGGPHSPSSTGSNPRRTAQWPSDQTEPSAGGVVITVATATR
jgi:hypothetical protein